ncbi:hypothetical protein RUND412_007704 [Rhizina undulata]
MADLRLPSGAYLISNKDTGTCLEIQGDYKSVALAEQDSHCRRERQIWWVEVLPNYEDDEEGAVYSISSIPTQEYRTRKLGQFGKKVILSYPVGIMQQWRVRRVVDDKEGEFYNILTLLDGETLEIANPNINSPIRSLHLSEFSSENSQQRWEFVIPLAAVPPGWVQIRSATHGQQILQQKYLTSPPFLGSEVDPSAPLNERINWGSQWAFQLEKTNCLSQNHWFIVNRLTHGLLGHWEELEVYKKGREINITALVTSSFKNGRNVESLWKLQKHRDGYWSIVNTGSGLVLEKVASSEMGEVRAEKKDRGGSDCRKWEFV